MDLLADPTPLLDGLGPLALLVLALVDSTSVGTLVVPVILLVTGLGGGARVAGRTLLYLGVIAAFYLAVGVALLAGLVPHLDVLTPVLTAPPTMLALTLVGAGLVWWSFRVDPAAIRKRGGDPEVGARRWTDRARRTAGRPHLLVGLALLAGVAELASMVPYLAAMGIIAQSGWGVGTGSLVLAGYCGVMILPGVLLCGVRVALGRRGERTLERVHTWAVRHAAGAFSWTVGIIGVLLVLVSVRSTLDLLGLG